MDETGPMANGDEQGTGPAVDDVPGRSARPVTRRRGPGSLIVRDPDAGVIGGVCQGIADRTGIDPLLLRLVAALAGLSAGLGVALYLTLWVTTPTRQDDRSPVERVLPCLRRTGWFGFAVLLLAVGAATVLAVHDLVPLTWWPIALIVLLVIIMWAVGPLRAARARRRRADAAAPDARRSGPVTAIAAVTLPLAAGAGAAVFLLVDARPLARLVCGVAAALGTIGAGLVLSSPWGLSRPLRDVGACLGVLILVLDAPFMTTLGQQAHPGDRLGPDEYAAGPLDIESRSVLLDLSSLPAQRDELTIQAHDAIVRIIVPADRTVTIEYSCFFSELALPSAGGCASVGSGTWTSTVGPGAPVPDDGTDGTDGAQARPAPGALRVEVRLVRSQMEVVR